MKKYFSIFFLICLLTTTSCQKESDCSKTIQEYYEYGVPNIDSEWTNNEIELAIKSLKDLKSKEDLPLPKNDSDKSSLLFKKMINIPSINIEDTLNYDLQFSKYDFIQKSLIDLLLLYGDTKEEQIYYSKESIRIQKLIIKESTNFHLLTTNYNQNNTSELIITGKEKVQRGLVNMFKAAISINSPSYRYNKDDKIQLAETVAENLKLVWGSLDKKNKDNLDKLIQEAISNSKYSDVNIVFSDLLKDLKRD